MDTCAPKYLSVSDESLILSLLSCIFPFMKNKSSSVDEDDDDDDANKSYIKYLISLAFSKMALFVLWIIDKPLKWLGFLVEFILNLCDQNEGFFRTLNNILHLRLVIPKRGEENFLSFYGLMNKRKAQNGIAFLAEKASMEQSGVVESSNLDKNMGNQCLMELCIMASIRAYDNAKVIKDVVNNKWKMHFVDFMECWNEYQKAKNTKVFIFCDKPKDANLIVVSFRGTEPFNAENWSSDFDFSFYEVPGMGKIKIHIGFLEAMGLGTRKNPTSFQNNLQRKRTSFLDLNAKPVIPIAKESAYYVVGKKLGSLLQDNKNAKFVVTGHSLGGALAILFPTVLLIQGETEMLKRLVNIYTFAQPRIGNGKLGNLMESHLNNPVNRYFRVVYAYDIVPRLPFNDVKVLTYKHFGVCLYYDSLFLRHCVEEVQNQNYFSMKYFFLIIRLNAMMEIFRNFIMGCNYGEEYKISLLFKLLEIIRLVIPGIMSHTTGNYFDCVKLGREPTHCYSSSFQTKIK